MGGFLGVLLIIAYTAASVVLGYHAADAGMAGEWDKGSYYLLWLIIIGVSVSSSRSK